MPQQRRGLVELWGNHLGRSRIPRTRRKKLESSAEQRRNSWQGIGESASSLWNQGLRSGTGALGGARFAIRSMSMEEILFQKSFHAVWQHMLKQATQDVQKLDRKLFNDPAFGGHLQRIATKYDVEVARFEGEMTAKRRTEER